MSSTRMGELRRTAEVLTDIAARNKEHPTRAVADILHMVLGTNRHESADLKDLIAILDSKKS